MKRILLAIISVFITISASAQLKVASDGKVGIATGTNTLNARLSVGWDSYFSSNDVGIAATPAYGSQWRHIGLAGISNLNSSFGANFAVFGLVNDIVSNTAANYGVCGMINGATGVGNPGGAGVLGSSNAYPYYYPITLSSPLAGYFYGSVTITGTLTVPTVLNTSDVRLKENIVPLSETDDEGKMTLERVASMNVVEYNLKNRLAGEQPSIRESDDKEKALAAFEAAKTEADEMSSRKHLGLVAQELQAIYPDMVQEGEDGYLAINYTELVPVLIRSIQVLKQEVDELKGADASARMAPQSLGMKSSVTDNKSKLFQNVPNPFRENTVIRFQLTEDVRNAYIYIFDMTGKMLRQIPIDSSMQSVTVNGYELSSGMYLYSLVINGQEIDTKRMILSK